MRPHITPKDLEALTVKNFSIRDQLACSLSKNQDPWSLTYRADDSESRRQELRQRLRFEFLGTLINRI